MWSATSNELWIIIPNYPILSPWFHDHHPSKLYNFPFLMLSKKNITSATPSISGSKHNILVGRRCPGVMLHVWHSTYSKCHWFHASGIPTFGLVIWNMYYIWVILRATVSTYSIHGGHRFPAHGTASKTLKHAGLAGLVVLCHDFVAEFYGIKIGIW